MYCINIVHRIYSCHSLSRISVVRSPQAPLPELFCRPLDTSGTHGFDFSLQLQMTIWLLFWWLAVIFPGSVCHEVHLPFGPVIFQCDTRATAWNQGPQTPTPAPEGARINYCACMSIIIRGWRESLGRTQVLLPVLLGSWLREKSLWSLTDCFLADDLGQFDPSQGLSSPIYNLRWFLRTCLF